jgi:hypothetical protein
MAKAICSKSMFSYAGSTLRTYFTRQAHFFLPTPRILVTSATLAPKGHWILNTLKAASRLAALSKLSPSPGQLTCAKIAKTILLKFSVIIQFRSTNLTDAQMKLRNSETQ